VVIRDEHAIAWFDNRAEKGFVISQDTDFPRDDRTTLSVDGIGPLDIKVRVPGWVDNPGKPLLSVRPRQF
jgi:DUF1680 family protein